MHILVCAATPFELQGIIDKWPSGNYSSALSLDYAVTGVGPTACAIQLGTYLNTTKRPDLMLNVGLAGALDPALTLGEVVHVVQEEYGDVGVEEANGDFTSATSMGLIDGDALPFKAGKLVQPAGYAFAKQVTGVTVSTVHGSTSSIKAFKSRCDAQVESMEGAAAMELALRNGIPFVQLRAISNRVEPRNRANWQIDLALTNLSEAVHQLLSSMPGALQARSARAQLGRS